MQHATPVRALRGQSRANSSGFCTYKPVSANSLRFCRSFSAPASAHATHLKATCFQQTVRNWYYPFYLLHIQKGGAISLPQMRVYGPFFGPSLACPPEVWRAILLPQKRAYGPFLFPAPANGPPVFWRACPPVSGRARPHRGLSLTRLRIQPRILPHRRSRPDAEHDWADVFPVSHRR
jgi:hypothetical protein